MRAWVKTFKGMGTQFLSLTGWCLLGCLVFPALPAKCQPFGGIIALTTMDFKGNNVKIDSFDSTTNIHSFWQYNLSYHGQPYGIWSNTLSYTTYSATSNSPSRTANVTVATDGSIINIGNAAIAGYVDTAPGGTVSLNVNGYVGDLAWVFSPSGNVPGNATQNIQAGHQRDDMNISFFSYNLPNPIQNGWQTDWFPVPRSASLGATTNVVKVGGTWTNVIGIGWTNIGGFFCTNTGSGWTVGGITYTAILTNRPANNTNRVFYEYRPNSGAALTESIFVDGQNQALWLPGGLNYSGSDTFTLNTNSDVQIWTTGDISTSGGGTINNLTKYTPAFAIYDVNGYPVILSFAGTVGTAYIYAPSSSLQFSGGGSIVYDVIGAIFCHDLQVNGHYNFHFDESLGARLPPWIISQPTNQILRAGSSGSDKTPTFAVEVGGFVENYQWFFNQTNLIPWATGPLLLLTNVQPTNAGNYVILLTNDYGAITSYPMSLVVWTDATPTLSAVAMPTNGQFQFNIAGVTGLNYGVQVSTDLVNWIPVATNISPFIFADTNANLFPQRFYRSVYPP